MRNYDIECWEETAEKIEDYIREDVQTNLLEVILDSEILDTFLDESIVDAIPLECEDTHEEYTKAELKFDLKKELINKLNNAFRHF